MTDGDGVTRRDAMKGAAALGLGTAAAESASAQGSSEPRLQIGDNVELDENASGEPVLRHQPSGAELRYDSGAGSWTVGSFTAERAQLESVPASYHFKTDGSTVWAIPQVDGMSEYSGSDVGPILSNVIENELPPTGEVTEANGRVLFKAGDYPGRVNQQILPAGLWLEGEAQNHFRNRPSGNPAHVEPITRLRTDNQMFIPANEDNSLLPFFQVRCLGLEGPGPGVAGSRIFDSTQGTNRWDVMLIENCSMVNVEGAVGMSNAHNFVRVRDTTIGNVGDSGSGFAVEASSNDYLSITGCDLFGNDVEYGVRISGNGPLAGGLSDSNLQFNDASKAVVQLDQGCSVRDVQVQRQSGTNGNGITCVGDMVRVRDTVISGGGSGGGSGVMIGGGNENNEVFNVHVRAGFDNAFVVDNGEDHEFVQCSDDGSQSNNSVLVSGAGPAVDANVETRNDRFGGSISTTSSPTRPRWNGVIGGGPFGGVDLSTTTGQFDGDRAMADGTATGASAGDHAIWDAANTQWNVFNADATV